MKPTKTIAALALLLVFASLSAPSAQAARRRPSKDAVVTDGSQAATPATVQTTPAATAGVPAETPAPAAPVAGQAQAAAPAQPDTATAPYPASSSALMAPSEKPVVETPIKQGKVEAGVSLAYAWTEKMTDTMTLRGRAGVFYTRELSLGASFTTNLSGSDRVNSLFFEPQYHFFIDPKIVPYVDGKIGFGHLGFFEGSNGNAFALGVGCGVKYFHKEDVYFSVQFDDVHYFSKGGIASLSLGVGISKLF